MCSDSYALEWPFGLSNAQLPPMRSELSKHSYGMP